LETEQNCLVLSAVVFTPLTVQDKTVLLCLQLCSHRQRGLIETLLRPDKTVLSRRVGGVNTTGDKARQFCHVSNCVHTADADKTKLIETVLRLIETGSRRDKNCLVGGVNSHKVYIHAAYSSTEPDFSTSVTMEQTHFLSANLFTLA